MSTVAVVVAAKHFSAFLVQCLCGLRSLVGSSTSSSFFMSRWYLLSVGEGSVDLEIVYK